MPASRRSGQLYMFELLFYEAEYAPFFASAAICSKPIHFIVVQNKGCHKDGCHLHRIRLEYVKTNSPLPFLYQPEYFQQKLLHL